jgi:hypothetical protein
MALFFYFYIRKGFEKEINIYEKSKYNMSLSYKNESIILILLNFIHRLLYIMQYCGMEDFLFVV